MIKLRAISKEELIKNFVDDFYRKMIKVCDDQPMYSLYDGNSTNRIALHLGEKHVFVMDKMSDQYIGAMTLNELSILLKQSMCLQQERPVHNTDKNKTTRRLIETLLERQAQTLHHEDESDVIMLLLTELIKRNDHQL